MSNKSVSDFVAAAMDAALKSQEYKSLFGTQYKFASDENDAKKHEHKCEKCGKDMDSCMCDSAMADDNAAKDKDDEGDSSYAKDHSDGDSSDASDGSSDDSKHSAAFDVAIDSLLTASAALDSVGMEKSASFSLKLASLVVEAKKKDKKDKKDSNFKKMMDAKKKKKMMDDKKKSDSKKSDSKKSDSKSSSSSSSSSSSKSSAKKK